LVDDDSSIRRVLLRILETGGYQVTAAATFQQAIECLGDGPPFDLFILDFWIGSDNGLELMAALRKRQPTTPVLFLSGGNESVPLEATTALAEMQGASEFLYKPVQASELLQAVRKNISLAAVRSCGGCPGPI